MICGRVSCLLFKKRDCGFTCQAGKHCDGYQWDGKSPIDPAETPKESPKQFDKKKDKDLY